MLKRAHWLFRIPGMSTFSAITLPWAIYTQDEKISPLTIVHEFSHLAQIKRTGVVWFYTKYLLNFIHNYLFDPDTRFKWMASYQNLFFEIEANKIENALWKILESLTVHQRIAKTTMIESDEGYVIQLVKDLRCQLDMADVEEEGCE